MTQEKKTHDGIDFWTLKSLVSREVVQDPKKNFQQKSDTTLRKIIVKEVKEFFSFSPKWTRKRMIIFLVSLAISISKQYPIGVSKELVQKLGEKVIEVAPPIAEKIISLLDDDPDDSYFVWWEIFPRRPRN